MSNRIKTLRRWCLLQAADALTRQDVGIAQTLWGKQEAEPGTPLDPLLTPAYDKLVAGHYKTVEDIDGADPRELQKVAGISFRDATAIFTALNLTFEL